MVKTKAPSKAMAKAAPTKSDAKSAPVAKKKALPAKAPAKKKKAPAKGPAKKAAQKRISKKNSTSPLVAKKSGTQKAADEPINRKKLMGG